MEFAAFCFLAVASLSLAVLAYSFGGVDFGVYYAAGRVFLQGGNPYEYSQLAGEIVSSTGELNNPYYYAPWFTWGVSLLAILPFQTARMIWSALNFVFWFWSLANLSGLVGWHSTGWRRWGIYLYATILFAWSTWGSEQVGILVLLFFIAVLIAHEKKNWMAMGVWMALSLFKPNIAAFPVFMLVVWLVLRGSWKPVAWMVLTLFATLGVSMVVSPGWYLALLQPDKLTGLSYTLNEAGEVQIARYTTTLLDWLRSYGITDTPAYVVYAFVVLVGLLASGWLARREQSVVRVLAYLFLINFAFIPYALFYDYVCMTLTLFFINFELAKIPPLIWAQRLMNGLIVASLFVGADISHRYWIVVILSVSAALGLYGWKRKTDAPVTSS